MLDTIRSSLGGGLTLNLRCICLIKIISPSETTDTPGISVSTSNVHINDVLMFVLWPGPLYFSQRSSVSAGIGVRKNQRSIICFNVMWRYLKDLSSNTDSTVISSDVLNVLKILSSWLRLLLRYFNILHTVHTQAVFHGWIYHTQSFVRIKPEM